MRVSARFFFLFAVFDFRCAAKPAAVPTVVILCWGEFGRGGLSRCQNVVLFLNHGPFFFSRAALRGLYFQVREMLTSFVVFVVQIRLIEI